MAVRQASAIRAIQRSENAGRKLRAFEATLAAGEVVAAADAAAAAAGPKRARRECQPLQKQDSNEAVADFVEV